MGSGPGEVTEEPLQREYEFLQLLQLDRAGRYIATKGINIEASPDTVTKASFRLQQFCCD